MRIESDEKLDFSDVLIRPKRSELTSRREVSLERTYKFKHLQDIEWTGIPIIATNMDTVGTFDMAIALSRHGLMTALHKHYQISDIADFFKNYPKMEQNNMFYSMGISTMDHVKLKEFSELHRFPKFICVDVANGYSEKFVRFISKLRDEVGDKSVIMAGNVVTGEMVEELILAGADIIKVGIGPGSVCTTRTTTGVGYPQLSAIIECSDAAHGLGGLVCADGGCTNSGDIAKAFGAGADFVMLGSMFAGHDESGGEIVYETFAGKGGSTKIPKSVKFYGMSSSEAMDKHSGGVAEYRASEGKSVLLPYRGPVENTVKQILGGIRSACTYTGAHQLKELSKRTTFIKVSGKQQVNEIYGKS